MSASRVRSPRPGTVQVCGGGIGKAKAYLESNLVEVVDGNNRRFCGSVCDGGRVGTVVSGAAAKWAGELGEAEVFDATLILVRLALKNLRPLRPEGKFGARKPCSPWRRIMLGNR